jgi:hypothetical protein
MNFGQQMKQRVPCLTLDEVKYKLISAMTDSIEYMEVGMFDYLCSLDWHSYLSSFPLEALHSSWAQARSVSV